MFMHEIQAPTIKHARAQIEEEIGIMSVKRIGIPKDIAYTALFLVSDKAGFIDGQTIIVDGGIMM